ncbi:MFS transporter [Paracoccus sp. MA]|uniref:MFS transporter n=1 Tax=Paracoccus sp. MA TaxID=2895796 RepID=UPI001E3AA85B|nr:MFS transporter [Paracoccus sp. MA]UFM64954.1 MFS transporter [Paracoccus sp. MA]
MMPVLESLGLRDATAVDMSLNAIQIAGAVVGVFLLHWMSRRGFVIWTFVMVLLTFLALGLLPQAPTWVVVVLFATYMFVAPAANNIQFVYPPEIFDTHVRATGGRVFGRLLADIGSRRDLSPAIFSAKVRIFHHPGDDDRVSPAGAGPVDPLGSGNQGQALALSAGAG